MIPFVVANLGVSAQKFNRHPNTRISLTRSFMLPSTLVSVRLTHGIICRQFRGSASILLLIITKQLHCHSTTTTTTITPKFGTINTLSQLPSWRTHCTAHSVVRLWPAGIFIHITYTNAPRRSGLRRIAVVMCEFLEFHTLGTLRLIWKCKLQCVLFGVLRNRVLVAAAYSYRGSRCRVGRQLV